MKHAACTSALPPDMRDYDEERRHFSWHEVRESLVDPARSGLSIAHVTLDRQVAGGLGGHRALRFVGRDGSRTDFTYRQLMQGANRFANVLQALGLSRDDRVFSLFGRSPVAPDVDPSAVRPELPFRDQFDSDSMDSFNFSIALSRHFGIDIPERDYRQLTNLEGCAAYLRHRLPRAG